LRRGGADWIVLVAPYLPYLRQDRVFAPGQPLSRDVVGRLLAAPFDRIVTVQPHLHRTASLAQAYPALEVTALSVAEFFARAAGVGGAPLVVGPDSESEPLAAAVAAHLDAPFLVLSKVREGDRDVALTLPAAAAVDGRRVVLVDDICASGGTLATAAEALRRGGARSVDALVAHAFYDDAAAARLRHAGVRRLISTDSCRHPSNGLFLAGLLASALREELQP
ncbi:MAG: ribose-phosphate diphosphokinase, partial [Proteobacteria bacterium]|nr:ribose-phosphate diphosphokinase [Pseudomonadota bacterium]